MKTIDLTPEQQEQIVELYSKTKDLREITRKVFNDESLDGRTMEGRAVRSFLVEKNLGYSTTLFQKNELPELNDSQKEFLMGDNIDSSMSALEITRLVFRDREIKALTSQHRMVLEFLGKYRPEIVKSEDMVTSDKYQPPKALSRSLKKINDWCGMNIDEFNISTKNKKNAEKLITYLHSPRFNSIINQFSTISDRELFESEFVRSTWDKPDLTVDELNLYITVCSNYIRQKHIQKRLDKLNLILQDSENERDITMRLTEIIKATSEELNQCEKRIESLTKDLNGSRQNRLKERGEQNGSILALVEAFQEKEERDRMVMMAQMQNKLIEEEADRLESMDDFKARILGISKREIL